MPHSYNEAHFIAVSSMETQLYKLLKLSALPYFIILHCVLAALLLSPSLYYKLQSKLNTKAHDIKVNYFRAATKTMLSRQEANSENNMIYFIGDSMVQGLNTATLGNNVLNLGIGHDKSLDVLSRLIDYKNAKQANKIIVSVGINDLNNYSLQTAKDNYLKLFKHLLSYKNVFLQGVLPVNLGSESSTLNKKINAFNQYIWELALGQANVQYIAPPSALTNKQKALSQNLHIGDGLHLNRKGYKIWIDHLKGTINDYQ